MQAKDVMTREVVTVEPGTEVSEIARILLETRISAVPVVTPDGRVVGIVSEGDLLRRPESGTIRERPWWLRLIAGKDKEALDYVRSHGERASEVMTSPPVTVTEDVGLGQIVELLESRRIKRVPVVRDGKLVGIVSRANLIQALASIPAAEGGADETDEDIREAVIDAIRREPWARSPAPNVIVQNGVVELWGVIESDAQRAALRVLVDRVPGVHEVRDHLVLYETGRIRPE